MRVGLNGRKFYCTGSLAGDLTFGPCRIEGTDEVRVFYTPTDAEGVTIHDDWSGFGQRTTASGPPSSATCGTPTS